MRVLLKLARLIYCIYALVVLIALMLVIFPFVVIASIWGKMAGGNFIYRLCTAWTDAWMFLVGISHSNLFLQETDRAKPYIFIANHISYLDIPMILKSLRFQPVRVLGKYEMKRWPVFGFIYRSAVIMVDRGSPTHRAKSVRELKSVLNRGISVFIYPEGTFNETHQPLKEFYDGAFRIAIETKTPIRPMLFLDTYDRMHYKSIFSLKPGRSRTVFLEEVPVTGLDADDVPELKQRVYALMEEMLIEYRASWIKNPQSL